MKWDLEELEHFFEQIKYFDKVSRNKEPVVIMDFLAKHVFFMFQSRFGITSIPYTPNNKINYGYGDNADEDGNIITYPVRMFYVNASGESTWFHYSFDTYSDPDFNCEMYYYLSVISDEHFGKTVLPESERRKIGKKMALEFGLYESDTEELIERILDNVKWIKKNLKVEKEPIVKRFLDSLPAEKKTEILRKCMEAISYTEINTGADSIESVDYLINESLSAYLKYAKNNRDKIKQSFFKEHCFILKLVRQIRKSIPSDLIESKEIFGFFFRYNHFDDGDYNGPMWRKNCRQIGVSLSYCMWLIDVMLKEAGEKFGEIGISFQKRKGNYEVKGGI